VEIDDPNITIEEYIELEAEEAYFPAIVYKDALAPDHEISSEPTVSPHHADGIDFDFKISFDESDNEDYIVNIAPIPPRDQRYLWLRYEGQEYTDADIVNFDGRLEKIYDRQLCLEAVI
ncbi:hypothetical protein Tco_1480321, partial [Tanacetum coccineum]